MSGATAFDVTVVIPLYNSSCTLERALNSVHAQTVQVSAVIVVDDGSSTKEVKLASEIVAKFPEARLVVLDKNGGPSKARNIGWELSSTKWIAFLDSDDAWHPQKIELQQKLVASQEIEPVIVATRRVISPSAPRLSKGTVDEGHRVKTIRQRDLLIRNQFATSSILVLRDIPHRFRVGKNYSEDFELWLKISSLGMPMIRIELDLTSAFKPAVGSSGLSAATWKMTLGTYNSYWNAYRSGALRLPSLTVAFICTSLSALRRHTMLWINSFR